ncbi:MAG: T9SS type A sorting domain-containing protein [Bacteroidia bacterium]|nr:T9SS type A sorting domain-containing protein [Bacteroidia bacterium]
MKKFVIYSVILTSFATVQGQTLFRSGIFLHHSTGGCIWGPNGSNTSVPDEMTNYNTAHFYTGANAVTMNEEWWSPDDNEWSTQHEFFEDPSPVTGIGFYLPDNKIIVIKTCFPASSIYDVGQPSDTLSPTDKTSYNYKWHWRHIINVMKANPDNFFVIWTNAPLEPYSTNETEAALSDWFCTWAKDTLAEGLDTEFGPFPNNVYVFDFFHKLTGSNGMMLPEYAAGEWDSHPNAAATELVAPQFVGEIFDAAIYYEGIYNNVKQNNISPLMFDIFPNPFRTETKIIFNVTEINNVLLEILDLHGNLLFTITNTKISKGIYHITFINPNLKNGLYLCRLKIGNQLLIKKIIIF